MKNLVRSALAVACLGAAGLHAQTSGNIGYGQNGQSGKAHAEQQERELRNEHDPPPTNTSMFIEPTC